MTAEVFSLQPAGRSLQETAAQLQSAGPAVRVELPGGIAAWSVTRHDVLRRLTEDDRISRDAGQHWPGLDSVPPGWPLAPFLISPTVLNAYGSDHRRLRGIMELAFTPDRVEVLSANLKRRLPALLAALGTPGSAEIVDVRASFAQVIAVETLCDLFGVPVEEWPEARTAMLDLLTPSGDAEVAARQLDGAMYFFAALISSKERAPGADMATVLAQAADLTADERVLALAVTVAGGVPATADLITNAVLDLLNHRDQLSAVLAGAVRWSAVVEETLRFDAPVQNMPLRYAVEDIDLGEGVVIRQGDPVLMGFGAGGRDPRLHGPAADTFDVHRPDKTHLAFGHGVHYCIGAPLGRLEAEAALPALFAHFPDLDLAKPADSLQPIPTFIFNGKTDLPVRL
ncbi:cytochrome P450 [Actinoplanes solisilvae]|uniref:cytochrome P450 n=1 Tax=Actinoplanes solisilvae TaxID=2486853 RepID=UPI000FD7EFC2|nr:cytochrome P450 [Actinoplanes solisilvae]